MEVTKSIYYLNKDIYSTTEYRVFEKAKKLLFTLTETYQGKE